MRRTSKEIILNPEERRELEAFTGSGTRSIKLFKRAPAARGKSPVIRAFSLRGYAFSLDRVSSTGFKSGL